MRSCDESPCASPPRALAGLLWLAPRTAPGRGRHGDHCLARRPDRAAARGHERGAGLRADRHRQRAAAPGRRRPGARPRGPGPGPRAPPALHRPPGVVRGVPRPHRPAAVEGAPLRPPPVRGGPGPGDRLPAGGRGRGRPAGAAAPGGRERPDLLGAGARQARRVLLRRHALEPAPARDPEAAHHLPAGRLRGPALVRRDLRPARAAHERGARCPLRPHRRGARAGEPERLSPRRRAGGPRAGEQVGIRPDRDHDGVARRARRPGRACEPARPRGPRSAPPRAARDPVPAPPARSPRARRARPEPGPPRARAASPGRAGRCAGRCAGTASARASAPRASDRRSGSRSRAARARRPPRRTGTASRARIALSSAAGKPPSGWPSST